MTDTTPPPGAIIPPRIGPIKLIGRLPDGWWLMIGEDVNQLGHEWEATTLAAIFRESTQRWVVCGRNWWLVDYPVIVRRRTVQVTVDCRPGDRVVVLSPEAMDGITDLGYGRPRTPNSDAFQSALDAAVVAE